MTLLSPWPVKPRTAAVMATALLLRLFVVAWVMICLPAGWFYLHGIELGTLADSLQSGHGLSSPFGGSTGPTALLAPAYPAVIALLFRIFRPFSPAAAGAIMCLQLLCSLATVLLIVRVAHACFGPRAANYAGAFWAVSLPLMWMPTVFWETCLSTLLLMGMVAIALRLTGTQEWPPWAGLGAYTAFASLVNPALLPSLLLIILWAAWQPGRNLWRALLAIVVFCVLFAPWPIRNARLLHAFIPLRSTVGLELWMGNRDAATGFLDESVFPTFNHEEYQHYVAYGEAAYMSNKSALAAAYIYSHPRLFLTRSAVRCFRFWTGTGTRNGSVFFALHALLTSLLGGLGILQLIREGRLRLATLFVLPLLAFPAPYYITHAEFRYRLVIDPLVTILGASAIPVVAREKRQQV